MTDRYSARPTLILIGLALIALAYVAGGFSVRKPEPPAPTPAASQKAAQASPGATGASEAVEEAEAAETAEATATGAVEAAGATRTGRVPRRLATAAILKEEGTLILRLELPYLKKAPPGEIFKELSDQEKPFEANWPGLKAFYGEGGQSLFLRLGLSPLKASADLAQKPLTLTWRDEAAPSQVAYELADGDINSPLVVHEGRVTTVAGQPFKARLRVSASEVGLGVFVEFNRDMVEVEAIKESKGHEALGELPFLPSIQPGDGRRWFSWSDPRSLVIRYALSDRAFQSQVVDQIFKIDFNPAFVAPGGERGSELKGQLLAYADEEGLLVGPGAKQWQRLNDQEFYLDRFRLIELAQGDFEADGQAGLVVSFNKALEMEGFLKAFSLKKLNRGQGRANWVSLDYRLKELSDDGKTAQVAADLGNGDRALGLVENLASLDGNGRIELVARELTVVNEFTVASYSLDRAGAYPWDPYFEARLR
ncbi:MAG: hypothetical protein LBE01_05420, partial [Deltaproteobacteria bacterium]|nr:hypothetical protein [Deltaproteobacteria bacterium]